ncbi:MAG: tyrosine-type recombinase/integrase [Treponema sp.]|nr:tyrosine-type recombinase/integrase [Treponema sp.]
MRQFYLSKNSCGYYRVHFIDPVTGLQGVGKSTHTKDRDEAILIASEWLKEGVPVARSDSRAFVTGNCDRKSHLQTKTDNTKKSLLDNLTESDIAQLQKRLLETNVKTETVELKPDQIEPAKPVKPKNSGLPLCETIENFWDYDNSEFIKRSILKGHTISKKHAFCMKSYVKNYWRPYFGDDKCIEDLTLAEMDDFLFDLYDQKELKSETVNKNINCANKCFKYLLSQKKIKENPIEGIERFKTDNEERGIPTEQEVRELLNIEWENDTAKLAFEIAAFYGLRAGEISGLRVCDVDAVGNMLHIRHSWSEMDKLKSTKNKDTRDLPIDHSIALQLLSLARQNPNCNELSFIFFAPKNNSEPFYPGYYADCFYKALEQIGVSKAEREDRNIVFHSLRHFCATILSQRADMKTVQSIMGHRSEIMTELYSSHDCLEKSNNIKTIMNDTWKSFISA